MVPTNSTHTTNPRLLPLVPGTLVRDREPGDALVRRSRGATDAFPCARLDHLSR